MVAFLLAVLPSAGVLLIFWIAIRSLVEADRRERAAQARLEAAQDAQARQQAHPRQEAQARRAAPDDTEQR